MVRFSVVLSTAFYLVSADIDIEKMAHNVLNHCENSFDSMDFFWVSEPHKNCWEEWSFPLLSCCVAALPPAMPLEVEGDHQTQSLVFRCERMGKGTNAYGSILFIAI